MFTGIIQAIGHLANKEIFAEDVRLEIHAGELSLADVNIGDSIAINGTCLTVVALKPEHFSADASLHTLEKTTLGQLAIGQKVNLEKCLQPTSYLGGHLVAGHVDGVGELIERKSSGRAQEFIWRIPTDLLPFIAVKGSITINGVSLTVNTVEEDKIGVTIIPHTQEQTTLKDLAIGDKVNLEVDMVARYVARFAQTYMQATKV